MNKIVVIGPRARWLHDEIKNGVLLHAQYLSSCDDLMPLLEEQKVALVIFHITQDIFTEAQTCIEHLHSCYYETAVLGIVSDLTQTQLLHLLCSGLDEYVTSSCSRVELKVRVNRLLHIAKLPPEHTYALADSSFSAESGRMIVKGKSIQFRRKEAQLLHCLFRYKNQLVKRDTLISFAWNECDDQPTRTTLDVYIRKIRMRMGELSHALQTVRGFGYVLTEQVRS